MKKFIAFFNEDFLQYFLYSIAGGIIADWASGHNLVAAYLGSWLAVSIVMIIKLKTSKS
jgi:hypothetical protein